MTRTRRPNLASKGVIRKQKVAPPVKVAAKVPSTAKSKKEAKAKIFAEASGKKSINTRLLEILRSRQASDSHLEKRIRMKKRRQAKDRDEETPEKPFDEFAPQPEKSFENLSHDIGLTIDNSRDEVEQFYERGDNFDEELNFD